MSRKAFLRIEYPRPALKNEFVHEVEREAGDSIQLEGVAWVKAEMREIAVHPVSGKYNSLVLPERQEWIEVGTLQRGR